MTPKRLLWILEDDSGARFVYSKTLDLRYRIRFFEDLRSFREALSSGEEAPDLVIADLRLPDDSFLTYLANMDSKAMDALPFIVVSSSDDIDILRLCFEEGASDYLTKPFNGSELIVKIQRILERAISPEKSTDGIVVDTTFRKITNGNGQSVQLTPKELQIFTILRRESNQPVSRHELIKNVWGGVSVTPKALDVHLFSLRKKAESFGIDIEFVAPDSFRLSGDWMNDKTI